jgi:hypothetical protein
MNTVPMIQSYKFNNSNEDKEVIVITCCYCRKGSIFAKNDVCGHNEFIYDCIYGAHLLAAYDGSWYRTMFCAISDQDYEKLD